MNTPSPLLKPFLFLPGLLLEGVVRARNSLFSRGVFARRLLPNPVISVGNITLGGTGKTPLVIYIAKALRNLRAFPALLSRGYGRPRSHEIHVLPPGNEVPSPARNLGDEPALIRLRAPEIWLGISTDRYDVGCRILERRSDLIFILDDGFQHRVLNRTLDILVIDCSQPLAHNHMVPRGTLREPLCGMKRADLIVLNTGAAYSAPEGMEQLVRKYNPVAPILHSKQAIGRITPFRSWEAGDATQDYSLKIHKAFLVAAIGNPGRFQRNVESAGMEVCGVRFYRDHHRLDRLEWDSCAKEAQAHGADILLITEKDAVKVANPPDFPLMVAVQSVEVQEEELFHKILEKTIGDYL